MYDLMTVTYIELEHVHWNQHIVLVGMTTNNLLQTMPTTGSDHRLQSKIVHNISTVLTKTAKYAGTKVKTEEKYKVTATQTHIYGCLKNKVY